VNKKAQQKPHPPDSRTSKDDVVPIYKETAQNAGSFPIVGIGASAGGLDALEQFLGNTPQNSGLAYVVIQHLDPTQKGMLPELLQRITQMKVIQAKDRMAVLPNNVYVIPPNKSMSILNRILYLFEPLEARGLRLPVDFFFHSLADDLRELSIGVILSGMGSDGSEGLRSIKEHNGIAMVQEPSTAKFDSMPRNAIDSVVIDVIAPASELPEKLLSRLSDSSPVQTEWDIPVKEQSALEKIIVLLRSRTGNDFSEYKKSSMYRRIERRMGIHRIKSIASFVTFLQNNPAEVDILFKELMIGVTNFFRDPMVWEKLEREILPQLFQDLPEGFCMRAWIAGCSTGEEAYTLAVIFKEALDRSKLHKNISLKIFATDIDNSAIEFARRGIFSANSALEITPERIDRYFTKTDDGYRVNNEIREMVVFAQHNLILHPPFTRIDIISCRNLLIYMNSELQKKILRMFYYSLKNNGILVLGSSETLGAMNHLFDTVESRLKIFKRSRDILTPDLFYFPSSFVRSKPDQSESQKVMPHSENIQQLADRLLIQEFSPPSVLVNENGDVIYISGPVGKYLEPATGKANMNIFAMLREELRNDVPLAFNQAVRKKETVVLHNLKAPAHEPSRRTDITIHYIEKPVALRGTVMIIFEDLPVLPEITAKSKSGKKLPANIKHSELENELQKTREEMQSTIEEMQASQEELKSANEELQSSNEELQSTNEELTSSKEEMQSLNEELQTVNAELQAKVDEFSRLNNDMKNLLNSTDIATLFLDKELNIRRYTNQATKIFKFIKSDIGRPFTDQVSDLLYPEIEEDAREVLRTLVYIQKQIPGKDGRWFYIRIMPYRTLDDRIDGLVITFVNISDLKKVEEGLYETEQIQRLLFNSSSDVIVKLTMDLEISEINHQAEKILKTKPVDVTGKNFLQMFIPEPYRKSAGKALQKVLNGLEDSLFKTHVVVKGGGHVLIEWTAHILHTNQKQVAGMVLIAKPDGFIPAAADKELLMNNE
jgi:two-component system, chemotaxis family, CheB/CheR fusion protein